MQHKEYNTPEIEVLLMGDTDVIFTASGLGGGDNVDNPDDWLNTAEF